MRVVGERKKPSVWLTLETNEEEMRSRRRKGRRERERETEDDSRFHESEWSSVGRVGRCTQGAINRSQTMI